eukprot:8731583-Karenia_brevis.AAC.1
MDDFARGFWIKLLAEARSHAQEERSVGRKAELSVEQEMARRGSRAQASVQLGEVSRARHQLTGAALAPRSNETRLELQAKRPQDVVQEIPRPVLEFVPEVPLTLDQDVFLQCL